MIYTYKSAFAGRIADFIDQKTSLGFKYENGKSILRNFDRFCLERFPDVETLTDEVCMAWATKKDTESTNSFLVRIAPLREFARFLIRKGDKAYVIPSFWGKSKIVPTPYIYTEEEIQAIWDFFDKLPPCKNSPSRHLSLPAMIKLLYCCGLRPCEARRLYLKDVDLIHGRLNILDSKHQKSRIVMMTDDVTEMLSDYNAAMTAIMPERDVFFPAPDGSIYNRKCLEKPFRQALKVAEITGVGERIPRLYDFRHTFATHSLYRWMREGKDVSSMIPYLSSYMGHSLLSDTYYYIHFVPGLFEEMSGFDFSSAENLLPEVDIDE